MIKSKIKYFFGVGIILFVFNVVCTLPVNAQLWEAIPPYNVLWPLWSPGLNTTLPGGATQPLVSWLDKNTILPVMPCFAWDPSLDWLYILYNDDYGNLMYFDYSYPTNPWGEPWSTWPPTGYTTPWGTPDPISLPFGYQWDWPTTFSPYTFLNTYITQANYYWTTDIDTWWYSPWQLLTLADLI